MTTMSITVLKGSTGVIINYRRAKHDQKTNEILIKFPGINSEKTAAKLIGKKIIWESPKGKRIKGKIVATHGKRGTLRARMEKGIPGEAIGGQVILY